MHSTLSPLVPAYPSPEHGTPAAASPHTPVGKEPEVSHHLKKLLRDVLFQPRDQLPLCQRFRRRFSRFVVRNGSSDSLLRCNAPAGKPLLVASSDNDRCSVPYSALRLSSSTCTHASIFRRLSAPWLLHCDSVVICDNDSGIARPSDHAFRSSCRIFHIHRERIASFRKLSFFQCPCLFRPPQVTDTCTCGCQLRRRPYVWMAQKIPGSRPRFRAAYSRFSTARRHTSFSSQRLLSNTGHSVSGRVKTSAQSQSGRRFSCVAIHRSVAFFSAGRAGTAAT